MEINERIRMRRKELCLSQEQLAKLIGYTSISTIAKIETGENNVPLNKLELFAKALNTSVEYLLTGDENKINLLTIYYNSVIKKREDSKKRVNEKKKELYDIIMSRESELDKIFNEYKSSYNFDNFNEKSSSSEFEKFAQMLKINLEDYSIIFLDIYFIFSDSFLINEMQYDIVKLLTDIDSTEATKEILELCKINTN